MFLFGNVRDIKMKKIVMMLLIKMTVICRNVIIECNM